jgi:hypothetical protein
MPKQGPRQHYLKQRDYRVVWGLETIIKDIKTIVEISGLLDNVQVLTSPASKRG